MRVKLIPRLGFPSYIENPPRMSEVLEIPASDSNHDVKDTGDKEEVGWENELMVVEMGYYS
jgi:hypothetical protein